MLIRYINFELKIALRATMVFLMTNKNLDF